MAAPQVRELQSLIAEQRQAIAPQQQLIDASIQANDISGQAQLKGLDVQKQNEFGRIEQGANDKGMLFSGFSPDEQAKYLGASYLPKVAELQATIAAGRSSLLGKKADLETTAFDKATAMREQDSAVLRDWEKMTAQQQFESSEADKQRVFQARQNELERQASAARSGGGGPSAEEVAAKTAYEQSRNSTLSFLDQYKGDDGFVSPKTYQDAKRAWTAKGQDPAMFDSLFGGWANPTHVQDYVGAA